MYELLISSVNVHTQAPQSKRSGQQNSSRQTARMQEFLSQH